MSKSGALDVRGKRLQFEGEAQQDQKGQTYANRRGSADRKPDRAQRNSACEIERQAVAAFKCARQLTHLRSISPEWLRSIDTMSNNGVWVAANRGIPPRPGASWPSRTHGRRGRLTYEHKRGGGRFGELRSHAPAAGTMWAHTSWTDHNTHVHPSGQMSTSTRSQYDGKGDRERKEGREESQETRCL